MSDSTHNNPKAFFELREQLAVDQQIYDEMGLEPAPPDMVNPSLREHTVPGFGAERSTTPLTEETSYTVEEERLGPSGQRPLPADDQPVTFMLLTELFPVDGMTEIAKGEAESVATIWDKFQELASAATKPVSFVLSKLDTTWSWVASVVGDTTPEVPYSQGDDVLKYYMDHQDVKSSRGLSSLQELEDLLDEESLAGGTEIKFATLLARAQRAAEGTA